MANTRSVLRNVQGLRAIAASLVVFMHMQLPRNGIDIFPQPILGIFNEFGGIGVDIFFAISGFIMIVSNWSAFQAPDSGFKFFVHRVIRIYPAYWLSIVPVLLIFLVARDRVMTGHVAGKTDLLASFLLYPQPVQHVLLPVSWTLVFEMSFYVIFALMLCFNRKYLIPFLAVWFSIQVGLFALFDSSANLYLKYLATALPIEFIFGVVIGIFYMKKSMPLATVTLLAGAAGIGAVWLATVALHHTPFSSSMGRVLFFGIPSAFVLYGMVALETKGTWIAPLWLVGLGDASYAIYLWHFSLISVLRQVVLKLHLHGRIAEVTLILLSFAGITIFSLLVYRLFEKPVTKFLNPQFARLWMREPRDGVQPSIGRIMKGADERG